MTTVTVEQAKLRIDELFAAAFRGEEIIISGESEAEWMISINRKKKAVNDDLPKKTRQSGFAKEWIAYIADDFDEFDEELQEMFADYIS